MPRVQKTAAGKTQKTAKKGGLRGKRALTFLKFQPRRTEVLFFWPRSADFGFWA